MNILQEKRENITEEDLITKSGQMELLNFLENLSPTTTEIVLNKPLQGELDFAILKECHYDNIVSIVLEPGEVMYIRNIPNKIRKLHVANNLLQNISDLPDSLLELNLNHNGIHKLDLTMLTSLVSLEASDNELVELKLPKSIHTVIINNNRIRELDLDGLTDLKKLHCNGNPLLVIRNFSDNINDFLMENNPTLQLLRASDETDDSSDSAGTYNKDKVTIDIDAEEAIQKYYELKETYEKNMATIKRSIYRSMPKKRQRDERLQLIKTTKYPCVQCRRLVNTIFSKHDRVFKAVCGDESNPCNLNIEIHAGYYVNLNYAIQTFTEELEEKKENIIKIKMDSLFGYRTDNSAVKKFKNEFEEYENCVNILKNANEDYNNLFFNKEKDEKIKEKSKKIFELQEEMKRLLKEYEMKQTQTRTDGEIQQNMEDIIALYTRELLPEYKNLQQLKYEFMEMDYENGAKLISLPVTLSKRNYRIGDNSTVKKFIL